MWYRFLLYLLAIPVMLSLQHAFLNAQTRDEKVRDDRSRLKDDKSWYYDDLETAIKVAKKENQPLMVVLRCIP